MADMPVAAGSQGGRSPADGRPEDPLPVRLAEAAADFVLGGEADDAGPFLGRTGPTGGVWGNARLTGLLGALLFVLLALEGATILRMRQFVALHIVLGFLLLPPTLLKIGSTSWRFVRYYSGNRSYVRKGPPHPLLRVIGPVMVLSTISLFATGIALVVLGPAHSGAMIRLHQISFVVWFAATVLHVLGHLVETKHLVAADWSRRDRYAFGPGPRLRVRGRWLRGALVALVLASAGWLAVLTAGTADAWVRAFRV